MLTVMHIFKQHQSGFTLIELLLVIANIGVLAGIVIMAINPSDQIVAATNAKRRANAREIQNAITQYVIDYGAYPGDIEYSQDGNSATSICRQGATGDCVNLDVLVAEDYLHQLPYDDAVGNSAESGYEVFINGPQAVVQSGYIGETPGQALACSPTNPQLIVEIADDEGAFTHLGAAYDVEFIGNYAYVVGAGAGYITIIDVSDQENPVLERIIEGGTTPGFPSLSSPQNLIRKDNYLFIKSGGIYIIDVSDPSDPTFVNEVSSNTAGFEVLYTLSGFDIQGDYLYAQSGPGSGGYIGAFSILDISDPLNITIASQIYNGTNGFSLLRTYGSTPLVDGNYAYLPSNYTPNGFTIVDVSNPYNPTLVVEITDGTGDFDRLDAANEAVKIDDYLYLAAFRDHTLNVIDVSDPYNPTIVTELIDNNNGFNRFNTVQTLELNGDILFAGSNEYSAGERGFITLIDVSRPWAPSFLAEVGHDTMSYLWGPSMDANANILYVAASGDRGFGMLCFD